MIRWNLLLRPLLVFSLSVVCGGAMAQPDKTKAKVVLYKDRLAAQFDTVDCVKNVVKINPLLFFRGEIPIYFERAITPWLSIEAGVGVTLRDYLGLSITGNDADEFGAGTEIVPQASFHVAFRYYLTDDLEPQGAYLQGGFSHLRYTKDIRTKGPTGEFTDVVLRDDRTYNDFRLLFGYQMLGSNSNWMFDVYTGAGFRDRYNIIVNERLDFTTEQYTYTVDESKDQVPVFFLGVKVGLGF